MSMLFNIQLTKFRLLGEISNVWLQLTAKVINFNSQIILYYLVKALPKTSCLYNDAWVAKYKYRGPYPW